CAYAYIVHEAAQFSHRDGAAIISGLVSMAVTRRPSFACCSVNVPPQPKSKTRSSGRGASRWTPACRDRRQNGRVLKIDPDPRFVLLAWLSFQQQTKMSKKRVG
ncbi:MAG: hypothetical protein M3294_06635, partial [Pseudomonadota bacterium]|nr:hypothetical protein [Pseudomonadota bacterium]